MKFYSLTEMKRILGSIWRNLPGFCQTWLNTGGPVLRHLNLNQAIINIPWNFVILRRLLYISCLNICIQYRYQISGSIRIRTGAFSGGSFCRCAACRSIFLRRAAAFSAAAGQQQTESQSCRSYQTDAFFHNAPPLPF